MALPGFDIAEIQGYVDQHSFDLISKTVLNTELASEVNVRVGLNGSTVQIPLLSGDFNTLNGNLCGFDTTGENNVDFSTVTMNLANKKYNGSFCPQTLRDTFLSQSLAAGAMQEGLSFAELMADYFVKNLKKWNEDFMILGEGSVEGLYDLVTAGTGGTGATLQSGTIAAWTVENAIAQSQALALAIPDAVADRQDLIMVVSPAARRTLALAITQENYYHIAPGDDVFVPGTSVKVVASQGCKGAAADFKIAGPAEFIILGTSLTSDYEEFKLFYSESDDEMRAIMRWVIGVAVTEANMFATTRDVA